MVGQLFDHQTHIKRGSIYETVKNIKMFAIVVADADEGGEIVVIDALQF